MAGVKGVAEFFSSHGSAITAALGMSAVIAGGSWWGSSMKKNIEVNAMRHQKDIELNKKDIEVNAMRHQKDIEVNKKDIEVTAMRVERDIAHRLLDLAYTEEMKPYRDSLVAKRQAETEKGANR
mmetsp:Transcript_18606/g.36207  ORF Transcript_18606/g.36207 Transcript_18606/m.36207 type:complete len:124 (-) Transcript_18606:384-755(-)